MQKLKKFGVADKYYETAESAKGDTYTRRDGSFPPTNLACLENPFISELQSAKYILDLGCGVGHLINFLKKQNFDTVNNYVGLDINQKYINHAKKLHPKHTFFTGEIFDISNNFDTWEPVLCKVSSLMQAASVMQATELMQATSLR